MKSISTSITIDAPASEVWRHLVDFESHADWNPIFASITGKPIVGTQLVFVARKNLDPTDPATSMTFRPEVLVAEPGVELRWLGKLAFGGLFDGTHYYQLMSMISTLMPRCLGASGSVRTKQKQKSASAAPEVQTFWPSTT